MAKFPSISGLEDMAAALKALPKELRRGTLRNALAAGGRVFRDEAQRLTPVIAVPVKRKSGAVVRNPGTVRKAITVRTSKRDRKLGDVGVFINVRPAKGAKFKTKVTRGLLGKTKTRIRVRASQRGADSPDDPFYWRWLEFGSRKMQGKGMLKRSAGKTAEAMLQITRAFERAMKRLNRKGAIKP